MSAGAAAGTVRHMGATPLLAGVHELDSAPAVSVAGRGLAYGELREAAAALAGELRGVERVAVWAESTLEACVASVAALCAGIPLVPVNPKLGRGELEHVLSDSRPDVDRRRARRRAARRSSIRRAGSRSTSAPAAASCPRSTPPTTTPR